MQFVTVTRRRMEEFPAEHWTAELLEQESQQVRRLHAAGTVRSIWRRQDVPGAVMLLEAADLETAQAAVATLPLAQRGMLELVICTGLEPYPGFGPR